MKAGATPPAPAPPLPLLRVLSLALLAWLGTHFAFRFFPVAPGDPLAGTLVQLPFLLIALYAIHRSGVRQGGRRLSRLGSAGELAALGVLVAAALARPALGLAHVDEVLAAGLLLVLAHRLARQLPALRPLLGRRLGARPSALFFWLPLTVYVAILPWSAAHRQPDGDEPYNLLIAHSLAYDGDANLTNNYAAGDWRHFMDRPLAPQPGDPVGPRGELYSRHDALLPLLLVPGYRWGGKTGAQLTMALLTAALAWLTLRLARHYVAGRPGEALAAYAVTALAPPLLLYSYQIWVEVPATLLAMAALDRILDLGGDGREARTAQPRSAGLDVGAAQPGSAGRDAGAPGSWSTALDDAAPGPGSAGRTHRSAGWKPWLVIALPVLLLPLLKIRFILIAGPLVALAAWQAGRQPAHRRQLLALGGLLLALIAAILIYNQRLYSNPLKIHNLQEIDPSHHTLLDYLGGALGLFYDAAFGLFAFAPLWLLLLPAMALLLARRAALPAHLGILLVPYLLAVIPRDEWYGGWSPPFRYALIALPLLGVALAPLLASRHRPGARALIAGLGALSLVLTLAWLVVPGWTYNFADGRTYALDHLASRLGSDLARFFPSAVRPRAATWIWPPLSLALVTGIWWLPRRRRALAGAALAGIAAVLAAAAVLPVAAARRPTRVVELEDPQVTKLGGQPYPDRWTIERTRFRGGWVLRVGDSLRAPVVSGGRRVMLTLAGELIRNQPVPFALDISAGDQLLAVWTPVRDRAWEDLELGPFDWPAGAPLVLAAHGPSPPGELNGAILDRVELDWR